MKDDLCSFLYHQIGDRSGTRLMILKIVEKSERKLPRRLPGKVFIESVSNALTAVYEEFYRKMGYVRCCQFETFAIGAADKTMRRKCVKL